MVLEGSVLSNLGCESDNVSRVAPVGGFVIKYLRFPALKRRAGVTSPPLGNACKLSR
jgi:hypothetical protein